MNLTVEQIDLVIHGLIKERRHSIVAGEQLILDFNNGKFKGKHHGPQNEEGLKYLLDGLDQDIAAVNELIEMYEQQREALL